jgi:hypothetical protein
MNIPGFKLCDGGFNFLHGTHGGTLADGRAGNKSANEARGKKRFALVETNVVSHRCAENLRARTRRFDCFMAFTRERFRVANGFVLWFRKEKPLEAELFQI